MATPPAGPRRLFLDCDGVLADFDAGARAVLGMEPAAYRERFGPERFWQALAQAPDFYGTLPLMPDARALFDAVRHLDPVILTGLPRGRWAAPQKVRWAARHFPGTPVLTVMAVDKCRHCRPGDVLVDDTPRYRDRWEAAGGIFVRHRSAAETLAQLARHFPLAGTIAG